MATHGNQMKQEINEFMGFKQIIKDDVIIVKSSFYEDKSVSISLSIDGDENNFSFTCKNKEVVKQLSEVLKDIYEKEIEFDVVAITNILENNEK